MNTSNIRQSEISECGLACIAVVLAKFNSHYSLSDLRRMFPVSVRGMRLDELIQIAATLGLRARPVRCEIDELLDLQTPAILHWGLNHYVVLLKAKKNYCIIHDPARGQVKMHTKKVSDKFTGVAVNLDPSEGFKKIKSKSSLKLTSLFIITPSLKNALTHVVILSIVLQLYVLLSPLYMQLAVDHAALKGDKKLLDALTIGFTLFGVLNFIAAALRDIATQKAISVLSWDMTGRFFHHLIRIPLPWFQKRRLADTLSRFDSLDPVRSLLTEGLIVALIDGVLAVLTLIMMFVYVPKLALVTVIGCTFVICLKWFTLPIVIKYSGDVLVADIAEQGKRIEVVKAIQTIKVMSSESRSEADWANKYAKSIVANQKLALLNVAINNVQAAVDMIVVVVTIYFGASQVITGEITVGIIFAFMSYRMQFASRALTLFDTAVNWRMLDLHSDRIADVVLTPTEIGVDGFAGRSQVIRDGKIELKDLAFRYAPQEPYIFAGLSVKVSAGEFVAITGPSGAGKSSLIKVICGLYLPSYGEILIDDVPLQAWGPHSIRNSIGVVLQDDELLAGTVMENVSFFAEDVSEDKVIECLKHAAVFDDIMALPSQLNTILGEYGAGLSGGQRQRIMLARALYKDPRILILDEATSHLDVVREFTINQFIGSRNITRIVVAHRPETIERADRILYLQDGKVSEIDMKLLREKFESNDK